MGKGYKPFTEKKTQMGGKIHFTDFREADFNFVLIK